MASDNREDGISRRHALECMVWVGTAVLWMVSGGVPQSLSLLDGAQAAVAIAQTKPTIPVIVKDTRRHFTGRPCWPVRARPDKISASR